jgi:hypothetical protein
MVSWHNNPEDTIPLNLSLHLRTTNAYIVGRMPSSGMLHRAALLRTDVSEERSASIIRVTIIGELGTLAVTSNRRTPMRMFLHSLRRLLVTANVVPIPPIIVTLMMKALSSS